MRLITNPNALLIWLICLFALLNHAYLGAPKPMSSIPIKTVIIDPGHGGRDPGAVGKKYYEKYLTLNVALKLKSVLEEQLPGVKVELTRENDHFVPLYKRAKIAQEKEGTFFISIHCNAAVDRSVFGTETYVMGFNHGQENYETVVAENQSILFEDDHQDMYGGFDPRSAEGYIYFKLLKNAFRKESTLLAENMQDEYREYSGRIDRGVKQGPFVVLYLAGMPAVLSEIGFISNSREETFIASEAGQMYIATSIYRAIKTYNTSFKADPKIGER